MAISKETSNVRWIPHSLWVLLAFLVAAGIAVACDSSPNEEDEGPEIERTFSVTVESIDDSYAYSDQNNVGVAYAIGGETGKVITLRRGKTYEFKLGDGVDPDHPFYIGNTAKGQKTNPYSNGVENANATTGSVLFSVPQSAPDSLYYECGNHVYMGGKMMIGSSSGSSGGY